jgi:putative endonuclease
MKTYCVYIMASASGVLYIGVTNNLENRAFQHASKMVAGFTARYNVRKLVYFELFGDIRVAIAREKQIKGWLRKRKIALIESVNPSWADLIVELEKARRASVRGTTPVSDGR